MRLQRKWYTMIPAEENSLPRMDETSYNDLHHTQKDSWKFIQIFVFFSIATWLLAILSIMGLRAMGASPIASAQDICRDRYTQPMHKCGNSTIEARALGCQFDILSAAWLPEECQDRELTEEFRATGPWQYYGDRSGQIELREDELSERIGPENHYWTSKRWHNVHCLFEWRKLHRAIARGARIDNALRDYGHTMHCGEMLLKEGSWNELLTEISVEFLSC